MSGKTMRRWLRTIRLTTRQQVISLLYGSYIYNAVRDGFLSARKRESVRYSPTNLKLDIISVSHIPPTTNLTTNYHLSLVHASRSKKYSRGFYSDTRLTNKPPGCSPKQGPRRYSLNRLPKMDFSNIDDDIDEEGLCKADVNAECPMPEMNGLAQLYQKLSTVFVVYASFKYLFISMVQYKWVDLSPVYLCYLPGRLTYVRGLVYETPLLMFLVAILHLMHRCTWNLGEKRSLDLSCFVFLCFEERVVEEKQNQVNKLNDPNLTASKAFQIYMRDRTFYQQYETVDNKIRYKMRPNRTVEHWRKLSHLASYTPFVYYTNLLVTMMPIMIMTFVNYASVEMFDQSYSACRSFANRPIDGDFKWSFFDPYRQLAFMFDLLEFIFFFPDVSFALVLPFCASLLLTQDLCLYFDALNEKTLRLIRILAHIRNLSCEIEQSDAADKCLNSLFKEIPQLRECIEEEAKTLYGDSMDAFDQVGKADKFMRVFAPFCIFTWFVLNMSTQIFALFRQKALLINTFVQFLQAVGIAILTISFIGLSRPYNKSLRLYKLICSVMALDPNSETTKTEWPRLLEFYHKRKCRHTLHILGTSYSLSIINYLRSMSWTVTFTIILLNLIRNRRM